MTKRAPKRRTAVASRGRSKAAAADRATKSGRFKFPKIEHQDPEGATEAAVGDRTGPGAGYDDEPEQVKDKGGVS